MTLTDIFIYPIKSLGAIRLGKATVQREGLQHDRRWMLLGADGKFLTQRGLPEMALLQPSLRPDRLSVSHSEKDFGSIEIPFDATDGPPLPVQVWDDEVAAHYVSREADEWFSDALGQSCQLVRIEENAMRYSLKGKGGKYVSFADGQPFLVIGEASLTDLNRRLSEPVPMSRFRPNLVFDGALPYAEDGWQKFSIGSVQFEMVKPCGRCTVTTIDQETGSKTGDEPLRTLGTYRQDGKNVNFGMRARLAEGQAGAEVRMGDAVVGS